MDQNDFPTKGNLMRNQQSLALAQQGFLLMDQKRSVLVREMAMFKERSQELKGQLIAAYTKAVKSLISANIEMGSSNVERLAFSIPLDSSVLISHDTIMGVELPKIKYENTQKNKPHYALADSTAAFDDAYINFNYVKDLIVSLAEAENTAKRLEIGIKKAQKRANALQYIIIPKYQSQIKYIQDTLAERERDAFTMLKAVKEVSLFP